MSVIIQSQVLSAVLLWNYALTKQMEKLPEKVKRDFVPTLMNGETPSHTDNNTFGCGLPEENIATNQSAPCWLPAVSVIIFNQSTDSL